MVSSPVGRPRGSVASSAPALLATRGTPLTLLPAAPPRLRVVAPPGGHLGLRGVGGRLLRQGAGGPLGHLVGKGPLHRPEARGLSGRPVAGDRDHLARPAAPLAESRATGCLTASLTGKCLGGAHDPLTRQCQGTPGRCVDPCRNNVETSQPPCGSGADCKATRYKAVCSCPRDHTVSLPFLHYLDTRATPSSPVGPSPPRTSARPTPAAGMPTVRQAPPLGTHLSSGKPGIDNLTGEDRPVCLCDEGFRGASILLLA
jgi:hypothetical protein